MIKINEREDRLRKLEELKKININPHPAKTEKNNSINIVLAEFEKLQTAGAELKLAGRLRSLRGHGNLTFAHLEDGTAKIQLAFSKKEIGADSYKIFSKFIDIGDFLEITGVAFLTHNGEKSVMVKNWKLLTKAIRPLPEKWHGLSDEEELFRKRYLDILFNPEVKEMFIKRAKFWQSIRNFLIKKDFLEVETPVLENTPGGAEAKPFITHHNALAMDVFLRISQELWLKRLIIAGYPKVFEIGRIFRNEGMDAEHLQDYTAMEFYNAYSDYEQGMKLIEEMYKYVAEQTFNTLKFKIKGFNVDLNKKWETYDYLKIIKEKTGVDILNTDLKTVETTLKKLKVNYSQQGFNLTRGIDNLWKFCRKKIAGPGFLINVPVAMEPLAKRMEKNPDLVERFQVILAGSEMGKGFSELNDPIDQAGRFAEQTKLREAGDEEAQMNDTDFVEALEYGMPPTFGFGLSERLFSFLMDKPLRECQIFPLMKPKKNVIPNTASAVEGSPKRAMK